MNSMSGRGTFLDKVEKSVTMSASISMRILGPVLIIGLHAIVYLHLYAFFTVITPLLKNRIGTTFGMIWIVVGLSLVYNILFNHSLACILKPGGPTDTKRIEKMRTE